MKERPIIMGAESVLAILEGRKTQTRRVINPQPSVTYQWWRGLLRRGWHGEGSTLFQADYPLRHMPKCRWQVGDRLWVRETWRVGMREDPYWRYKGVQYKADELCPENEKDELPLLVLPEAKDMEVSPSWRPPMFMPRWASRINLEITDIRVERLPDISNKDAKAEGVQREVIAGHEYYLGNYHDLWNSLNAKRGYPWESNPWVWVVTFKQVL